MRTAEEAYQSVLDFCKGYEVDNREKGHDYLILKQFVKNELKEEKARNEEEFNNA